MHRADTEQGELGGLYRFGQAPVLCTQLQTLIETAGSGRPIKELLEQVALDVSCRRRANPGNVSGLHPHPADHIRRLVRINV